MLRIAASALAFAAFVHADEHEGVCGTVTGTANKRCVRCITEEPFTGANCQFDLQTNKCVLSGAGQPAQNVDQCPEHGFQKKDCLKITTNMECRLKAQCGWNRATRHCVPKEDKPCDQFEYNVNCMSDDMAPQCMWVQGDPNHCVDADEALCFDYTIEALCVGNGCTYNEGMLPPCSP
jgi:hypothetical protein